MSDDFDFEPVPGLPAHLPTGERMLWRGRPDWKSLALRAFHVRKLAIYCAVLLVWSIISSMADGLSLAEALKTAAIVPLLAAGAICIPLGLAWLYARTTVYTITSKRVVIRSGVALPMTINLPYKAIGGAGFKAHADGTGDIPLSLTGKDRIAYLQLWPNARPWRVARPEPMLRSVPDGMKVAEILARALAAAAEQPVQPVAETAGKATLLGGQSRPQTAVAA
jgi:Bacterial PH domain